MMKSKDEHYNCNIAILTVFILGAIFADVSYFSQHTHFFQKHQHIELTDKYKEEFLRKLSDLFYLTKGDYALVCGIGCQNVRVDVNDRRKYFTANGWKDYMEYVSAEKSSMTKNRVSGGISRQSAAFSEDSDGRVNLTANVGLLYMFVDLAGPEKNIQCEISFFGFDAKSGADFEIDSFRCD